MVWFLEIQFKEMEFDDFNYICHHKGIHSLYAFLQDGNWKVSSYSFGMIL